MSVEKFLNNENTVKSVLNSIKNKVNLPKKGFLAGGSISNILFSLYHTGSPWLIEINDVDIFTINPENDLGKVTGEFSFVDRYIETSHHVELDDYGSVYINEDGSYYQICDATRNGLINDINCNVVSGSYEKYDKFMIILNGFDINSCKSGIDLETGKLYYTKDFVQFLKTKQMMVSLPYMPLHTTLRLIKKLNQYGGHCYCNLNDELTYLFQSIELTQSNLLGTETLNRFKKYEKMGYPVKVKDQIIRQEFNLGDYFTIDLVINPKKRVKDYDGELYEWEFSRDFEPDGIPDHFEHYHTLKSIWDLKYRPKSKSQLKKINNVLGFIGHDLIGDDPWKHSLRPLESFLFICLMNNPEYYKCDFTVEHLKEISDFMSSHRSLVPFFSKYDTIQEQYRNVRKLKSISKKEGEWVIGVLEVFVNRGDENRIKPGTQITKELIDNLIKEEKELRLKPLIEPLDLTNFKYKKYIRELVTTQDLQDEGDKMGHCVGGYSHSIKSGYSRIFHIEVNGIGSTLEISGENHNIIDVVKIKQHSGRSPEKGNLRPTNKNRGVAFKLIHFLNIGKGDNLTLENKNGKNPIFRPITTNNNSYVKNLYNDGHKTRRKFNYETLPF